MSDNSSGDAEAWFRKINEINHLCTWIETCLLLHGKHHQSAQEGEVNMRSFKNRLHPRHALLALGLASACSAWAAPYYYVDWTTADVTAGTAAGLITLPDASTVGVSFAATFANGAPGNLYGAQTGGGTNFWIPSTPYMSGQVDNAPPGTDILQLSGGQNQRYTVTLSAAIKDPIMAIVSLGQAGVPTTYEFDEPFTIVSQGPGFWGGTATSLSQLPGNVLLGTEGHGTIQFLGTFSTFSWTVPTPESWHGFTFGIRTTQALEPASAVPEPGSLALVGLAMLGCALARRRLQG